MDFALGMEEQVLSKTGTRRLNFNIGDVKHGKYDGDLSARRGWGGGAMSVVTGAVDDMSKC